MYTYEYDSFAYLFIPERKSFGRGRLTAWSLDDSKEALFYRQRGRHMTWISQTALCEMNASLALCVQEHRKCPVSLITHHPVWLDLYIIHRDSTEGSSQNHMNNLRTRWKTWIVPSCSHHSSKGKVGKLKPCARNITHVITFSLYTNRLRMTLSPFGKYVYRG